MNTYFIFNRFNSRNHIMVTTAAALWFLGLIVGIVLTTTCPADSICNLRFAVFQQPSFVCLLLATSLPIIILYLLLNRRLMGFCYPLFLTEAICRGFCGMLLFLAFGSCSWLIRFLFMFSHSLGSVLIWSFFLQNIYYKSVRLFPVFHLLLIANFGICLIDYFIISRYLSSLLLYF